MESKDRLEELLKQALRSHGMDPDEPEMSAEIARVLQIMHRVDVTPLCPLCSKPPVMVIGDTALCGDEECKTVFWDRTKSMDELLMNMGLVDLRQALSKDPPGSGWDIPHEDTPGS